MKLLFKRAPEVQRMQGRLLAKATEDVSNQDLHDRALLYYRLLRSSADPKMVEKDRHNIAHPAGQRALFGGR